MAKIPDNLLRKFGQPTGESDHCVRWKKSSGGSVAVILWYPGSPYAVDMQTGERHKADGYHSTEAWTLSTERTDGNPDRIEFLAKLRRVEGERYDHLHDVRGLHPEDIDRYCRVIHGPAYDDFVILPILEDGVVVSYQMYDWKGGARKYQSPPTREGWMPTSSTCWGLDRILPHRTVYVAEGFFDAVSFETGTAILGSNLHENQVVRILDRRPSPIVCVGQNDGGASNAFVAKWLRMFRSMTTTPCAALFPPDGFKDFGDVMAASRKDR